MTENSSGAPQECEGVVEVFLRHSITRGIKVALAAADSLLENDSRSSFPSAITLDFFSGVSLCNWKKLSSGCPFVDDSLPVR